MSTLLFRLRSVPEDEAEDIRSLLRDANVEFYETDAGNWGISMPAIWLIDDADLPRAKALLNDFQTARGIQARTDWQTRQASGQAPGPLDSFRHRPLLSVAMVAFCLFILYVSINPFIELAKAP